MSKSVKSAYFRHVFANNIFVNLLKTFSTALKSAWNFAFFDTHIKFLKKFFLLLLAFFKTLNANAHKTTKKRKLFLIYVSQNVIR